MNGKISSKIPKIPDEPPKFLLRQNCRRIILITISTQSCAEVEFLSRWSKGFEASFTTPGQKTAQRGYFLG